MFVFWIMKMYVTRKTASLIASNSIPETHLTFFKTAKKLLILTF